MANPTTFNTNLKEQYIEQSNLIRNRKSVKFKEENLIQVIPSSNLIKGKKSVTFDEDVSIRLIPSRKDSKTFFVDFAPKKFSESDGEHFTAERHVHFYNKVQVYLVSYRN